MIKINRNPSSRDLKWFGLLLLIFFGVLGSIARWRFDAEDAPLRLWLTGSGLCVIYYALPPVRRWMFLGWMYAAFPIGWTVSHLLLMLVYYLILTPVGLALRLTGRDLLDRGINREAVGYWTRRGAPADRPRYFRQF